MSRVGESRARPTLPALLLGGWLGAGKTTLLNGLLRQAQGRRVAVLVNDFGQVNLDAELIVGAEAGVLQLAGGCLCCSFGDDLFGTLRRVAARDPAPECLVIELSGVALPGAVRSLVQLVPEVFCLGSLVLADATQVRQQVADRYVGDTVRQQLAGADWLLPSKTDLIDPQALAPLQQWLGALAPDAALLTGHAPQLAATLLFGEAGAERTPSGPRSSDAHDLVAPAGPSADPLAHTTTEQDRAAAAEPGAAAQPGDHPDGLPLRRPHRALASRSLALPAQADLDAWLQALADPTWRVLRAKAWVADGHGAAQVLQWAEGRGELTQAPAPPTRRGGHLVLIGLDGGRLDALVAAVAAPTSLPSRVP